MRRVAGKDAQKVCNNCINHLILSMVYGQTYGPLALAHPMYVQTWFRVEGLAGSV